MALRNNFIDEYIKTFHSTPTKLFASPCRINIIGEHTDYNMGLALPAAISKYTGALVGKRNDHKLYLKSLSKNRDIVVDLDKISNSPKNGWANYPLGVFAMLIKQGYKLPFGLNILYGSTVPMGSGLSSSASLLNLTAFIASTIYGLKLRADQIALLAHQSETEFNGLQCGIMDEFAIALGKKNHCILLNCETNQFSYEPIDLKNLSLVVIVSNVKRNLIASPYNQRVAECKKALDILKSAFNISSLSGLTVSDLEKCKILLNDDILYRRVKHVVSENQRVRDFVKASKEWNVTEMCKLLNASHESLRDDYEVTGEYLDYIHDISLKHGALAERMTGAGFGGSSIALIDRKDINAFKEQMQKDYKEKYDIELTIFEAEICDGLIVRDLE